MKKVKSGASIVTCYVILAATMTGGLSADTPQSLYQLPSNAQVIAYLLQSVNWYRHAYAERQVTTDPADLLFLHDNQAVEEQITSLSFDFAKADAALVENTSSLFKAPMTPGENDPPSSDLAHFIELKSRNDQAREEAIQEVDTLNRRIAAAGKADRQKMKVALDDVQSRLELLQAVSQTVDGLIEFVQSAGTDQSRNGNLDVTIEDLAQSVPELNSPSTSLTKLPVLDASSGTTPSGRAYSVLRLASQVSALDRKLRVVDEKIQLTDELALSTANLRTPMTGLITRLTQTAAIGNLQTSDLSLLRQQRSRLDAVTLQLKGLSPAIVALDKQKVLLAEYKSHVVSWRTVVATQYKQASKKLIVGLLVLVLIIGLLIGIGETSRRLALRRIHDPNRRTVVSIVHRLLTFFAIVFVTLFGIASDLSSLATYFGLLTAGIAVALQNVILASLGYLLLVGRRGIRIGDRVQVSGIAGDVINMGLLQFQLKEFDLQTQKFTGHVATFSNSLVFVSPAIGLLKFNSAAEKTADA
jgi:mechanosensitive ion channel-like protein